MELTPHVKAANRPVFITVRASVFGEVEQMFFVKHSDGDVKHDVTSDDLLQIAGRVKQKVKSGLVTINKVLSRFEEKEPHVVALGMLICDKQADAHSNARLTLSGDQPIEPIALYLKDTKLAGSSYEASLHQLVEKLKTE
jgi:hypothetical protein